MGSDPTVIGKPQPIPDKYRLDRLLVPRTDPRTGKVKPGFETIAGCVAEDQLPRARSLRETAAHIRVISSGIRPLSPNAVALKNLNIGPEAALNLADRLEAGADSGCAQPTLGSALFMREQRLRLGARLLELIDNHPELEPKTFTVIHPSWGYPAHRLMHVDAWQLKNQFRTHLNRAGVTNAPGFLFACLHGEFEPFSREYQLHFHGVCAGEKLKRFNRLRNKQGYTRTQNIYRPIVLNQIRDPARQISYLIQSFWPKKARVSIDDGELHRRERSKGRIREPYQSLYLVWLDRWILSDLCELNGIRIQGGRIVLS